MSNDVYDAILDREEPVDLYAEIFGLKEKLISLQARVDAHERLIEIIERHLSRADRL